MIATRLHGVWRVYVAGRRGVSTDVRGAFRLARTN